MRIEDVLQRIQGEVGNARTSFDSSPSPAALGTRSKTCEELLKAS